MFSHIYLLLQQQIKAVPGMAEVDWYNNQYLLDGEQYRIGMRSTWGNSEVIYDLPAAYIEFTPTPTQSLPRRVQKAVIRFKVHTVTHLFEDNDKRFETSALDHYNMVNLVYDALLDHSAILSDLTKYAELKGTDKDYQIFNAITRINIAPGPSNEKFQITIQEFETQAWDWTGNNKYKKITSIL
jgi:hypothetical protein